MEKGFTLIEILVVMVIIAIATSVIVFSTGSFYLSGTHIDNIANEMAALIRLARNQAIFSLSTLGLDVSPDGYQFLQLYDTNNTLTWNPLGQTDQFWSARSIPSSVYVQVKTAAGANENVFRQGSYAPQIIFFPSGEITPFTITLSQESSSKSYTITGSPTGIIKVTP